MKAAVLHGQKDLRYEEIERPQAGEGEVVIRVKAAGICGSDIPRVLGTAAHYYPIVLGHEFSGVIEELGPGVSGLRPGQRVTAAPLCPCMQCADCQRGDYSLCKHYRFIGSSLFGSFADFVKVPARNVVPFGDEVDFVKAAFFEPSTIGLFTMQWARLLGAQSVSVFDISDARLALAKRMGADRVYNTSKEGFLEEAVAAAGGEGFGFVFETAGQNATMALAFEAAANRASVCFIGTSSRDLQFPWKQFEKMNRKEFRLTGSWMSYSAPFPGREWRMTADYLSDGRLALDDALVWKRFPMSEAAEAFALYENPGQVGGKIMLVNED